MKRVLTLDQIEVALFGTTDGGMLDGDTELPVSEMRRLLHEAFVGDVEAVRGGNRPYLAKFATEAFQAARQAMPADQITVDVIVRGMDAVTDCRLDRIYGDEMIRTAAQWALTQQPAADLPVGSVVASDDAVWMKNEIFDDDWPWTCDGTTSPCSDKYIDERIASGKAEVLRVGTGKAAS